MREHDAFGRKAEDDGSQSDVFAGEEHVISDHEKLEGNKEDLRPESMIRDGGGARGHGGVHGSWAHLLVQPGVASTCWRALGSGKSVALVAA